MRESTLQARPIASFAPNPVPITIQMAPIAGRTHSHRRCSGSAGCGTIWKIHIARKTLRPRRWRRASRCTAMAVPTAVLAIVMATVRSKATGMGETDRRHHGYLDDGETKDEVHQPFSHELRMPRAQALYQFNRSGDQPSICPSARHSHREPWHRTSRLNAATRKRRLYDCPLPRPLRCSAWQGPAPGHGRLGWCLQVHRLATRDDRGMQPARPSDRDGRDCSCHPFPGRLSQTSECAVLPRTRSAHRRPRQQSAYRQNSGLKE